MAPRHKVRDETCQGTAMYLLVVLHQGSELGLVGAGEGGNLRQVEGEEGLSGCVSCFVSCRDNAPSCRP